MQEYVRRLRELEEEAKAGLDRQVKLLDKQTRLYESIRDKLRRAEAAAEEQSNGENGDGEGGGGKVIIGPWAAAVATAGVAGKSLFGSARRAATTTAASVVVAGGIGFAMISAPHQPPPPHGALPVPPASPSPPGVRSIPKIGPPKQQPLALVTPDDPARDRPADDPRSSRGGVAILESPIVPTPPAVDPSPTDLPLPTTIPSTPTSSRRCLVDGRPALPVAVLCWSKS